MNKRRQSRTLEERNAEMKANGTWDAFVARQEARDREMKVRRARGRAEEEPILSELRTVGWNLIDLGDLRSMPVGYPEAFPILFRHLNLPYSNGTRQILALCLGCKEAAYLRPELVAAYRSEPHEHDGKINSVKHDLAFALSQIVTRDTIEEHLELAQDRTLGTSRVLLLAPLRRSKNPKIKEALEELASDLDLAIEIATWRPRKPKAK